MKDEAPGTEAAGETQYKCFIGGLSYNILDADLKAAFDRYDCASAKVMIDRHTGRPRGFGFVWFKDEAGQKEAIAQMHDKDLEGRRISVVRAVPESQTSPGTPAAALGGGSGARRDYVRRDPPRDSRGGGYDRGGYGGGGGYDRGSYDRGGYGGYDVRYAYDRGGGYDRGYAGGGSGYASGYERSADPYRDAYRGGYGGYGSGYAASGYEDRGAAGYGSSYGGYDRGYDDRGAGGPDRRGYSASTRSAPYSERPPERRPSDPSRR